MEKIATPETEVEGQAIHRSPHSFQVVEHGDSGRPPGPPRFERIADEPVTHAYKTDPEVLFNSADPSYAVLHEKPEHRIIVYLKAQGLSNKEIASRTGYGEKWLSQLTRQPWFRLRLVHELKEAGIDAVSGVVKAAALDSVFTLIELRDNLLAPSAVRKSAADSLLDRYLGKPTQKVETTEQRLPSSPEIAAIDKQLVDIDKQLETPTNGSNEK